MKKLDFIYNRHSTRKFKNEDVPMDDIKTILSAATHCPSAKNIQNWHFAIVKSSDKIQEMALAVEKKTFEISSKLKDTNQKERFNKFLRFATVFKKAPVVILVYASTIVPHGTQELAQAGGYEKEIEHIIKMSPQMQSIGSLIQTLSLAATQLGYGSCWMTSANYAAEEISDVINFNKDNFSLAAIVPIGLIDGPVKSPPRKQIDELISIIE